MGNFQVEVVIDIVCHPAATGYVSSLEDVDELHRNDIKEMMNLLTVSELRDILCKLKKVRICGK